jgi:hypothetical protein
MRFDSGVYRCDQHSANRKSEMHDSITFTYCHCVDENVSHLSRAVTDLMADCCCASLIPKFASATSGRGKIRGHMHIHEGLRRIPPIVVYSRFSIKRAVTPKAILKRGRPEMLDVRKRKGTIL